MTNVKKLINISKIEKEKLKNIQNNIVNNWREEWIDMPEYISNYLTPYKTVKIHFRCEEDYKKFGEIFNYKITEKTKSLWFPEMKRLNLIDFEYIDESELKKDDEIVDITGFNFLNDQLK
jgi:hypothetical protein